MDDNVKIVVQKNGFGIRIVHCGIEDNAQHKENTKKIDRYVISYLTSGRGYYTLNGKRFVIKKGDIYAKFQNVDYSQETDKNNPYKYYYIAFFGSDCSAILEHAGLTIDKPVLSLSEPLGKKISQKMKVIYNNLGDDNYLGIAKSVVQLLEIFCILFSQKEENVMKQKDESTYVEEVKKYVEGNVFNNIKVNDISRHLHVNRAYLSQIFSKSQKITIKEYITKCKIDKATSLLFEGKMSISAISNVLGYDTYVTFYRQFVKHVGISPVEYKKYNMPTQTDNL